MHTNFWPVILKKLTMKPYAYFTLKFLLITDSDHPE